MSDFFAPLLEPKPSAAFKLIAAWEGLSLESQMKLLLALKDTRRGILPDEIARKALSSPNAYLRFLAAKMIGRKEGHPLLDMIARDSDPLVRSAQDGFGFAGGFSDDFPAAFWKAPHANRLAYLSKAREAFGPDSNLFVRLLKFALSNKLPDKEIWDVAVEYVETIRGRADSYGVHMSLLWEFVPEAPRDLAYYLIERLPNPVYFSPSLRKALIDLKDEHLLFHLLDRKEPAFRSVRRAVLKSKILKLDADTKKEVRSLDRARTTEAFIRWAAPFAIIGFLYFLSVADFKVTSFVAAAAATAALLRTFNFWSSASLTQVPKGDQ